FVEKSTMDGLRKSLAKEFTSIYVLNLRGDIRKNMLSNGNAKEGENIFGSGSMTGIAVTLFIKKNNVSGDCKIYYHDIGNNLTTKEKLTALEYFGSISGITNKSSWQMITPDKHSDWINQRDDSFKSFLVLGDKKGHDNKLFETFSYGIKSNRDAWAYNSSRKALAKNMSNMIAFYNSELERFNNTYSYTDRITRIKAVDDFINSDVKKISWSLNLKKQLVKGNTFEFEELYLTQSLCRPFIKQWLYYNSTFNEMLHKIPRIFPIGQTVENRVIQVSAVGARCGFSVLMTKNVPDVSIIDNSQCFPRYLYEDTMVSK
ncbi:type ISP restriction/modification enzyme, partial [Bartonella raoultii]|uniref:type ISP restriction/modification enzyme n=1 Tax=Bartonella raoultii TaxID=1457020 RepID=UPI00280AF9D8